MKGSRKLSFVLGLVLALGLMSAGITVSADGLDGKTLFTTKTCFACHGPDAKTSLMPQYPKLAGQNYEYLTQQFHDIKSGKRNNGQTAAMIGIAQTVSDAEAEAILRWIAAQPR